MQTTAEESGETGEPSGGQARPHGTGIESSWHVGFGVARTGSSGAGGAGPPVVLRGCSQTRPRPGACVWRVLPLPFRPHVPLRGLLGMGRCCPCASGLGGECSLHLIHKSERYVQFLVDGRKVEGPSPIPRPRRSRPCPCTKEPHSSRKGRYI